MSFLSANLAVLDGRDPALAKALRGAPDLGAPPLTTTPSGARTIVLEDAQGRAVPLHSRHDPRKEAERFVAAAPHEPGMGYVVVGAGIGHHVKALLARTSPKSPVFVLESRAELLKAALGEHDFRAPLAEGRLHLCLGASTESMTGFFAAHVVDLLAGPLHTLVMPAVERVDPGFVATARHALALALQEGEVNLRTSLSIVERQYENLLGNLGDYLASPGIAALRGACRGMTGLVVGAGPSLSQALPLLAKGSPGCVLAVVSTALKPALAAGVTPDLTLCVDFHPLSRRYFEDVPGAAGITLFADPAANHEAVTAFAGPKLFCADAFLDRLLGEAAPGHGTLDTHSNVACAALSLLDALGCDPVVLVGVDLAYTAGVTHAPGSAIAHEWQGEVNRFHTQEMREFERIIRLQDGLRLVRATNGGEVFTNAEMHSYAQQIARFIAASGRSVVNTSLGGALITGAEHRPLAEAIDNSQRQVRGPIFGEQLRRLHDQAASTATKRRLAGQRALDRFTDDLDEYLKALDAVRGGDQAETMRDFQADAERRFHAAVLARDLARRADFERLKADRMIPNDDLDARERCRRESERDRAFLDALARAGGRLSTLAAAARRSMDDTPPLTAT